VNKLRLDGKWWFIDPEGYLFYSNGSCCFEPGTDLARLKGREFIFRQRTSREQGSVALMMQVAGKSDEER
jgi:hypothetical protein